MCAKAANMALRLPRLPTWLPRLPTWLPIWLPRLPMPMPIHVPRLPKIKHFFNIYKYLLVLTNR